MKEDLCFETSTHQC